MEMKIVLYSLVASIYVHVWSVYRMLWVIASAICNQVMCV